MGAKDKDLVISAMSSVCEGTYLNVVWCIEKSKEMLIRKNPQLYEKKLGILCFLIDLEKFIKRSRERCKLSCPLKLIYS